MIELDDRDPRSHVLNPQFGLDMINQPGPAEQLAKMTDQPVRDGVALGLMLTEMYDTMYGIFDHSDVNLSNARPLALVAMHEKERVDPHTGMHRLMQRFVRYRVKEYTGLNFTEFVQLPRDMVEHWFDLCRDEQMRANNNPSLQQAQKEMDKLINQRDP